MKASFFKNKLHGLLWGGVLAVFVALGVRGIRSAPEAGTIDGNGRSCVVDGMLRDMVWEKGASARIVEELGKTGAHDGDVAVFFPGANNNLAIVHEIVSYLAWPRKVVSVPTDKAHLVERAVALKREGKMGAMVFYMFPPPPGEAHKIGLMSIVPLERNPQ